MTLALGIGVNAVAFSVTSAVFVRPLQYKDAESLVSITQFLPALNASLVPQRVFAAWRDESRLFEDLAAYSRTGSSFNLSGDTGPVRFTARRVSPGFLTMLAGRPALGRFFEPEDGRAGAPGVAVLSHGLWTRRFGGDGDVIGRNVTLDGASFTVIGVAPRGFRFPGATEPAIFVPMRAREAGSVGLFFVDVVGRLDPGVTATQAALALQSISDGHVEQVPGDLRDLLTGAQVRVRPLQDVLMGNAAEVVPILAGVALLVVMIAGVNVANLQLGRMRARQREISVRTALGATRLAMVRKMLVENLLLSALGGVAALLLVHWSAGWAAALLSQVLPYPEDVRIDAWVLVATLVTVGVLGIASGLAPALAATRQDRTLAMTSSASGTWSTPGRDGRLLLIGEVALTVVLLVAAGLLMRSLQNLTAIPPGFDPRNIQTARLSLPGARYPEGSQQLALFRQLLEEVRALPGVESAAAATSLPVIGTAMSSPWTVDHPSTADGVPIQANVDAVSAGYFHTLGIPLLAGRGFGPGDADGSQPVAIVTDGFARRFSASESLLGGRIRRGEGDRTSGDWLTVVGIVGDVRHRDPDGEVTPQVYRPLPQISPGSVFLAARTAPGAPSMVAGLRSRVRAARRRPAALQRGDHGAATREARDHRANRRDDRGRFRGAGPDPGHGRDVLGGRALDGGAAARAGDTGGARSGPPRYSEGYRRPDSPDHDAGPGNRVADRPGVEPPRGRLPLRNIARGSGDPAGGGPARLRRHPGRDGARGQTGDATRREPDPERRSELTAPVGWLGPSKHRPAWRHARAAANRAVRVRNAGAPVGRDSHDSGSANSGSANGFRTCTDPNFCPWLKSSE